MRQFKPTCSQFDSLATSAVLLATLCLLVVQGPLRADASGSAAKATFAARCAMCHGADGAGSQVGKTMNVPDLRSAAIQKTAESQLAEIIANGKNGMPPFKASLSAEEIHGLVGYIHTFGAKK